MAENKDGRDPTILPSSPPVSRGLNAREVCAMRHYEQAMYALGLVTWTESSNLVSFSRGSGRGSNYSLEDH